MFLDNDTDSKQHVSNEAVFTWGKQHETAFRMVKQAISEMSLLELSRPEWPHEVHMHVSTVAVGAALLQCDPRGKSHIIEYRSKVVAKPQPNLTILQLDIHHTSWTISMHQSCHLMQSCRMTQCHWGHLTEWTHLESKWKCWRMQRWWTRRRQQPHKLLNKKGQEACHTDQSRGSCVVALPIYLPGAESQAGVHLEWTIHSHGEAWWYEPQADGQGVIADAPAHAGNLMAVGGEKP